jgi:hypothetical protein
MKTLSTQNKEKILKAAKEKIHVSCKEKPIRKTAHFSSQTLNTRSHGKT